MQTLAAPALLPCREELRARLTIHGASRMSWASTPGFRNYVGESLPCDAACPGVINPDEHSPGCCPLAVGFEEHPFKCEQVVIGYRCQIGGQPTAEGVLGKA